MPDQKGKTAEATINEKPERAKKLIEDSIERISGTESEKNLRSAIQQIEEVITELALRDMAGYN